MTFLIIIVFDILYDLFSHAYVLRNYALAPPLSHGALHFINFFSNRNYLWKNTRGGAPLWKN